MKYAYQRLLLLTMLASCTSTPKDRILSFESTLDLIDAQYGSMGAYRETALGFSASEQATLRGKLLE